MAVKKVINNFLGGSRKSDMALISQSYTQNLVLEAVGDDAPSQAILRSIPGLSTFVEIAGTPRGRFVASKGSDGQPRLFVCFSNKLYCVDRINGAWTPVEVGYVNGGTDPVSMCETGGIGTSHPMLCIVDGSTLHVCETDAPAAEISSTYRNITLPKGSDDLTIEPTHCAYLYGYLVVNDKETDLCYRTYQYPFELVDQNNNIFWDVFTTWPTAEYNEDGSVARYVLDKEPTPYGRWIASDWVPDNTTALVSTGGIMFTLGPRSLQRFTYTNDDVQPFNSPNTSSLNIGILAPNSLATIGDSIYFIGSSDVGQFGIYRADGSTCERISVPEMERCISKFRLPDDAIGFCWTENTHVFYAITFQGDDTTYVYDASTKTWSNRVSTTTTDNRSHAWRYRDSFLFDNRIMFLTDGAVVFEDTDKWTEHDGRPIVRLRRGGALVNGGTPFYVDNVVFMLSNGYGNMNAPAVRPKVMFRYSTNGTTMSNERVGNMGRQGEYNFMTVFTRCGYCQSVFNMELSCSENIDFTILKCTVNSTSAYRGF